MNCTNGDKKNIVIIKFCYSETVYISTAPYTLHLSNNNPCNYRNIIIYKIMKYLYYTITHDYILLWILDLQRRPNQHIL